MRITLIYDNETVREDLKPDWGFACLVDVPGTPRILFDTGADGQILRTNMTALGIDPSTIAAVFISHGHNDHRGGLSEFLNVNPDVTVYVPAACPEPEATRDVVVVRDPREIYPDVFSTGVLKGIEQSLAVRTEDGVVVIAGCSHPGVKRILRTAAAFGDVTALVGGLHAFRRFAVLQGLRHVCPCHCTRYKAQIQARYPDEYLSGGAGRVLDF